MDVHDQPFFLERDETDAHKSFIKNQKQAGKRSLTVRSILEEVFTHHKAVCQKKDCPKSNGGKCQDYKEGVACICETEIASIFYEKFYVDPRIAKGSSDDGAIINEEDFVERLISFPQNNSANNLTFLLGEVGCGKTAFLNFLITKYGLDWFLGKNIFFVRVDAHVSESGQPTSYGDLLSAIIRKIKKILTNSNVKEKFDSIVQNFENYYNLEQYDIKTGEMESNLAKFFLQVQKTLKYRMLIIIDNLDQMYHRQDRKRFLEDITLDHDSIKPVIDLASAFFHEKTQLGSIGANVLFAFRHDTYDIISETAEQVFEPQNIFQDDCNAFTLVTPSRDDVVHERFGLLSYICTKYLPTGKKKDIDDVIRPIKEDLYKEFSGTTLVDQLSSLSSFGLRGIMRFFSQYGWINEDLDIIGRYFEQYHLGLIAFMLRGRRRFNQVRCRLPNLYLVRSQYCQHPHTYWLKRLIVEYIYKSYSKGAAVYVEQIVSTLCEGDIKKCYQKEIVLECIGSLSEVHESNVACPILKVSADRTKIKPATVRLTNRGKYLYENIFDKFIYIQLIVDDNYLPIIDVVGEFFLYNNGDNLDYGYIILPEKEYQKHTRSMLLNKFKQVNLFLSILDYSLNYEKIRFKTSWTNIEALDIAIDMQKIKSGIRNEMKNLASYLFLRDQYKKIDEEMNKISPKIKTAFENLTNKHVNSKEVLP